VNKVLQDDERLPEVERQSRAAARITGSLAATAASVSSGIAASVGGVGVLAGGAVLGGVAVAAAVPMAAALVLGFGVYGVNKAVDRARDARRSILLKAVANRPLLYARQDCLEQLCAIFCEFLSWGSFPSPGFTSFRKRLRARTLGLCCDELEQSSSVRATLTVSWNKSSVLARSNLRVELRLKCTLASISEMSSSKRIAEEASRGQAGGDGVSLAERRIRKKAADLGYLLSLYLSWDHYSVHLGAADCHGSGAVGFFRQDLSECVRAFSRGLAFEDSAHARATALERAWLSRMATIAAAMHHFLLWNALTPQLGTHAQWGSGTYKSFAKELRKALSSAFAATSSGADTAGGGGGGGACSTAWPGSSSTAATVSSTRVSVQAPCPADDPALMEFRQQFVQMRGDETPCGEAAVRAVCSCKSLANGSTLFGQRHATRGQKLDGE